MSETKTKIDKMIEHLRNGEQLLLDSSTSMEDFTDKQREDFYRRAMIEKNKGSIIYKWLTDVVGIDEKYLNDLVSNEAV